MPSTVMMTADHPELPALPGLKLDPEMLDRDSGRILEALGQGVCVCRSDGSLVWGNRVFRSYGVGLRKRVAVACRRVAQQFDQADPDDPQRWRRRQVKIGFRKSDRFFEVVVAPLAAEDDDEGDTRFVAVVTDVTPRETMRRKISAINAAGRDLLRIEPDTIRKLHVQERLGILEQQVTSAAHDVLNFDHYAVRLLDPDTNKLELVMSTGLPREAMNIDLFASEVGHGISGYVAVTGRAYLCPDCCHDPRYVSGIECPGSSLTVPLRLFGKVVGVFNIEADCCNAFTDSDRQFAEIFGHSIAMALHVLNLLVVERSATREVATGSVQGELSAPLNDLVAEAEALQEQVDDPEVARHIQAILRDVSSIRRRVENVALGPRSLLGAEEALADDKADPILTGRRMLVADNEPVILHTIRDVLTKRGSHVTTCGSGDSAIKLLDQWRLSHDADQGFDLIICDINLGDRTGYEVFSAAKNVSENLPVILMTGFGYDPHHSIVRASQEGLQCVLFKPFQVEKLIEEARDAISSAQGIDTDPSGS